MNTLECPASYLQREIRQIQQLFTLSTVNAEERLACEFLSSYQIHMRTCFILDFLSKVKQSNTCRPSGLHATLPDSESGLLLFNSGAPTPTQHTHPHINSSTLLILQLLQASSPKPTSVPRHSVPLSAGLSAGKDRLFSSRTGRLSILWYNPFCFGTKPL